MSEPRINRQWRLKSRPVGMVSRENFQWTEEPVPPLKDGEFLVRNLYLSFDPTQRAWMAQDTYLPAIPIGDVMRAGATGQVIESKHPDYKPGEFVSGGLGWQDYCIADGKGPLPVQKVPPGIPLPMSMSVVGLTGLTAYFGMLRVGQPKAGETVVVSGAAGATGSVAAQIAKIKGARVIGIAGGKDKCDWLLKEAKLDAVIDYKHEDVDARTKELCPKGVNVYFDNVGGEILDVMLANLALNGRIVLCGGISQYNNAEPAPGPKNYLNLVVMRGKMEGFLILDYAKDFVPAAMEIVQWVAQGKLKYQVDIQQGLEHAPETFQRIFTGQNHGKQLLKIADAPLGGEPT